MTPDPSNPVIDQEDDAGPALLAEARRRVGTTLRGKWKLERILGVGGMGAVYEARHRNGLRGAVKVLDSVLARTRDCRERFLREGRLANQVEHVGAVRVLDDDETDDGSAFLVMELLEGVTLERLAMMRGGTLPPDELARCAAQVLDTLTAAHARGIVHRDIKPENLLLTDDGVVKILDFGIARMNGLGEATRVTRAGEPIGTPAFMSPEQARGHLNEVDGRTDLYSLGATMFNLATGEPIHADATTVAELLATVITRPARRVKQAGDVPDALAAIIDRALSFDKGARFASAEEMRGALETAYVAMTGESIPATPTPAPVGLAPPPPSRLHGLLHSRGLRRAAALLVPCTIAAASLVVVVTRADPEPHRAEVATIETAAPVEPVAVSHPVPSSDRARARPPAATAMRVLATRDDDEPAHAPVLSRGHTEEKSDRATTRVEAPPKVGAFSRWSPLYERRR